MRKEKAIGKKINKNLHFNTVKWFFNMKNKKNENSQVAHNKHGNRNVRNKGTPNVADDT